MIYRGLQKLQILKKSDVGNYPGNSGFLFLWYAVKYLTATKTDLYASICWVAGQNATSHKVNSLVENRPLEHHEKSQYLKLIEYDSKPQNYVI